MQRTDLSGSSWVSTLRPVRSWLTGSKFFRATVIFSLAAAASAGLLLIYQTATTAQSQKAIEVSEAASLVEAAAAGLRATRSEAAEQTDRGGTSGDPAPLGASCGWTASTVVPVPILDQATAAVGGNLYTFGGVSNSVIVADSYRFDGSAWTPIAPLPAALEFPTAVTDGTNIFILGGALVGTGTPQTTVYRYNVAANTYTPLAPFTTGTWNAAAVYLNGKIYKFTGTGPATASTNVLEIYDVAANSWSAGAPYPLAISFVGAFVKDGFIYGAGGIQSVGSVASLKTYRYDPAANTWDDAAIADMPQTRWGAASSITGYGSAGSWVLAGGYVNGTVAANISATAIRWNSTSNTWSDLPNMSVGDRSRMTGAMLGASFYVVGGRSQASSTFVGTNSNQKLLCVSGVAVLNAGAATVTSGNNLLEPNECNTLNVPLTNEGDTSATAISAVLSSTTPGITVTQPNSGYPTIPGPGGPSNNAVPFQVQTDPAIACFTTANFTLTVNYTGGASPAIFNFSLPVGIPSTNYVATPGTGTAPGNPANRTLLPGSQIDDSPSIPLPLPAGWTSMVYNVPVTSLSVGANGTLQINGVSPTVFTNTALPYTSAPTGPRILPFWDDHIMTTARGADLGVFTEVLGSAPNRQLVIEWRAQHFNGGVNENMITLNHTLVLNEGSSAFSTYYTLTGIGAQVNGSSATVGVQFTNSGTQFTQFSFNQPVITPGMKIDWALPAGQCTPGPGGCGAVANWDLGGQVLTSTGAGIRNARLRLSGGGLPTPLEVQTSSFGYYNFVDVPAGTYTLTVISKRFTFANPSVMVNLSSDITNQNFTANPALAP